MTATCFRRKRGVYCSDIKQYNDIYFRECFTSCADAGTPNPHSSQEEHLSNKAGRTLNCRRLILPYVSIHCLCTRLNSHEIMAVMRLCIIGVCTKLRNKLINCVTHTTLHTVFAIFANIYNCFHLSTKFFDKVFKARKAIENDNE